MTKKSAWNKAGKRQNKNGEVEKMARKDDILSIYTKEVEGNKEAGDDCGVKSLFRSYTGSDGKCDRKWQGDDGNDDAGNDILDQLLPGIALHDVKKFWF